jgi:PKD repeat protein
VPGEPTAEFTSSIPDATHTISFTDTTKRGRGGAKIVAWRWDFGDTTAAGNTSTARNPKHTYAVPGTYTVKLTVTDANGLTSTVEHPVTI